MDTVVPLVGGDCAVGVLGLCYSALVIIAFSPLPLVSYPQGGRVGESNFDNCSQYNWSGYPYGNSSNFI